MQRGNKNSKIKEININVMQGIYFSQEITSFFLNKSDNCRRQYLETVFSGFPAQFPVILFSLNTALQQQMTRQKSCIDVDCLLKVTLQPWGSWTPSTNRGHKLFFETGSNFLQLIVFSLKLMPLHNNTSQPHKNWLILQSLLI